MQQQNPYGVPMVLALIGIVIWIVLLFLGKGALGLKTYSYISGNGTITTRTTAHSWRSECHQEDVMDGWNIFEEEGGWGWSMCRRCGKWGGFYAHFPTYQSYLSNNNLPNNGRTREQYLDCN